MTAGSATRARRVRPPWLPLENVVDAVAAGRWWDAVAIDGELGIRTVAHYRATGRTGPIICDPQGPAPRVYFLVPLGTADRWHEEDSFGLGQCCYVVLNGDTGADALGIHWLSPPRCQPPEPLVQPRMLRTALTEARATS
ncbi:hypothetical protein [Streptomyces sp. S186]|uniref:hypothetical protein n=1 Tax=Streptomyces sp. S186 TaxID=3434395 RepID=UPI003F66F4B9